LKKVLFVWLGFLMLAVISGCVKSEPKTVTAFIGSASKPPMEEAIKAFKEKTGIQVYASYGGSGTMLSQIELSESGDLYIPGSQDYLAKAERNGVVDTASVQKIAYLVPTIGVQKGNPKNIRSLADLAKPGIKVGIGNPQAVCLGLYAVEIMDYNHLLADIDKNIVVNAESCEKIATLLSLKTVDAVIGWDVFQYWDPENIDVIYLSPEQLPRLAYIPGVVTEYAQDADGARQFLDFLTSDRGQAIFQKWGYITTESGARKFAPDAEIGGEYTLPPDWENSKS
jgi:molybdate transport system substrate-binding protein